MRDVETGKWYLVRPILAGVLMLSSAFLCAASPNAKVTVTGPHEHAPELVLDGKFLEEGSGWAEEGCLYWEGDTGTTVVMDLGEVLLVEDLMLQVDNNDSYLVEWSAEGEAYAELFTILLEYGEIDGGMDTFSTRKGDGDYVAKIDFEPVRARHIRLKAVDGDEMYSVSEIQILSKEPATKGSPKKK